MTMVRGTERSAPIGPQSHPQKSNESTTTRVESPMRCPMICGSTMLPIAVLIPK